MKELRDFINRCEEEGELLRIKKEVDWHLELGTVAKLSEERKGPALLFENVKGYDIPVLTSAFTTTRLATHCQSGNTQIKSAFVTTDAFFFL